MRMYIHLDCESQINVASLERHKESTRTLYGDLLKNIKALGVFQNNHSKIVLEPLI